MPMNNRHAFQILEQLGPEADRLGIKVVDAYGKPGTVSEFLPKVIRYIEAREAEIDRLRLTDEEREAIEKAAVAYARRCDDGVGLLNDGPKGCGEIAATLRGLLERLA